MCAAFSNRYNIFHESTHSCIPIILPQFVMAASNSIALLLQFIWARICLLFSFFNSHPTAPAISQSQTKDPSRSYVPRLELLLQEIGHRFATPPTPNREFLDRFREWIHNSLGPVSGPTWKGKKLLALEDQATAVMERAYPYADADMKFVMGRLTAMVIVIDDSLEDDQMYEQLSQFAHRLYLGEPQPAGLLTLYHEAMKDMSTMHDGDAVLRGLALVGWISFADAALLEKRLLTFNQELRASPLDMGYTGLALRQRLNKISASSRSSSRDSSAANSDDETVVDSQPGSPSKGYMKGIGHANGKAVPLEGAAIKLWVLVLL